MTRTRTLVLALGFTALGALGATALPALSADTEPAARGGYGPGYGRAGTGPLSRLDAIVERLELDESQQQEWEALRDDFRAAVADYLEEQRGSWAEAFAQLDPSTDDLGPLYDALEARSQARLALGRELIDDFHGFYASLSPEQRTELRDFAQERCQRMGWGAGRGMHGHHGRRGQR